MDARVRFDKVVAGVVMRVLCENGGADVRLRPVALEGGEVARGDGRAVPFEEDLAVV